jgi:signal transduction histidine kinase/ActR/RegA family two-component response regulator
MSSDAHSVPVVQAQQSIAARVALALALYPFVGGLVSFAGWALDVPGLTDWEGNGISIQPNACIAAVGASVALFLAIVGRRIPAVLIAAAVAFLGALTAFENVTGIGVGIDQIFLFGREWGSDATTAPGRMGVPASLSWLVLGASVVALTGHLGPSARRLAPWAAALPLAVSAFSLLGYLHDSSRLYTVPGVTAIAFQTATFIFVASAATIAGSPDGPMRLFADSGPAGIAARRLLPVVVLVPLLTGSLRLAGERAGLYDTAFGVALHNLVEITLLLTLLGWTGLAIARHSSERERAEAERRKLLALEQTARQEAERQATIRDEFLATLSHELRTPLNAILGWAQIVQTDFGDGERVRQAISVIERNARLQAQMIADLLDMSRILAGKMRLHVQPVDLAAVVSAALEAVQPAADAKGIRIQRVLEPLADVVHGDPGRLQQVVWNLLANAIKFTPRDGRVQVVVARVNSHVEIRVSDTGEGIAPEFLPRVFERFRQADASAARIHGGLGLGLAVVKQLVELHGGNVTAFSDGLGRGAMFTVALPFAIVQPPVDEPRVHPLSADGPRELSPLPRLDGLSLLVADDEADSLQLVAQLLQDCGALVATAASAREALVLALARPFDLIVSDIGMPGRDGYELIKDIRARGLTTPAVALTAYARSEDRTKALSSGYQGHVAKPVEVTELLATVAALVQRPKSSLN